MICQKLKFNSIFHWYLFLIKLFVSKHALYPHCIDFKMCILYFTQLCFHLSTFVGPSLFVSDHASSREASVCVKNRHLKLAHVRPSVTLEIKQNTFKHSKGSVYSRFSDCFSNYFLSVSCCYVFSWVFYINVCVDNAWHSNFVVILMQSNSACWRRNGLVKKRSGLTQDFTTFVQIKTSLSSSISAGFFFF